MIARIWKGETPESKSDQYFDFLKVTGIPEYLLTMEPAVEHYEVLLPLEGTNIPS